MVNAIAPEILLNDRRHRILPELKRLGNQRPLVPRFVVTLDFDSGVFPAFHPQLKFLLVDPVLEFLLDHRSCSVLSQDLGTCFQLD